MNLKKILPASLLAAGIAFGSPAYADQAKIPVITGLPYSQARAMLIAEGWQPAQSRSPNAQWYGQAKAFDSAGFWEIYNCAATEAAPCDLYFHDAYGGYLKVVTAGEATMKGDDFPIVDSFLPVKRLPPLEGMPPVPLVVNRPQPTDMPSQTPQKPAAVAPASANNESKSILEIAMEEAKRVPPDADCVEQGKVARYIAEQRDNRVGVNIVIARIGQKYEKTANSIYRHPEESPANIEIIVPQSCMASKIALRRVGY